jgi:hypothetical protein
METIEEDNNALVTRLREAATERRTALYEAGELLDSSVLCERLRIPPQKLSEALHEKRVFFVEGIGGAHWYPSFFADNPARARLIERVSVALGSLLGDAKLHFFTSPRYSLCGGIPLAVLENGEVTSVLRAAEHYRERSLGHAVN